MLQDYFLILMDWWRASVALRNKKSKPMFKEGEIWWCSIGMNIGAEIFGKGATFTRPVIIFKKFNSDLFLGIPLTSQQKSGPWYLPIHCADIDSCVILNQARSFDAKRLMGRMATLTDAEFAPIKQKFLEIYSFNQDPEIFRPTSGEAGLSGESQ
jgi:mRNA interferase MazF